MGSYTVNSIFDILKERRVCRNPVRGGYRFDRKERVNLVFPERLCAEIASRSLSYYSWFLNMDRQGVPVRDYLRRLFEEDAVEVVQEMVEKCGRLLGMEDSACEVSADGGQGLSPEMWAQLLDMAGREIPLLVHGTEGAGRLARMSRAAPPRALAWLFLAAGMGGFTPNQYVRLNESWRMMNRAVLSGGPEEGAPEEAQRRINAGELLYLDGNRLEAVRQFEQAADRLRDDLLEEKPSKQGGRSGKTRMLGEVLLRLGEMYLHSGADAAGGADDAKALEYLRESLSCGCVRANEPLAVLALRNGLTQEAEGALRRGAEAGIPACLRMLGNSYYRGDGIADGGREPETALRWYLQGACPEDPSSGDAVCQYMLGLILEETLDNRSMDEKQDGSTRMQIMTAMDGQETDPGYWFAAAARQGNTEAAARLNRRRWHESGVGSGSRTLRPGRGLVAGRKICLVSSLCGKNRVLADTLPADTFELIVCEGEGAASMAETLFRIGTEYLEEAEALAAAADQEALEPLDPIRWLWDTFPEILCAALDEDEERNIRDGLQLLRAAVLLHERTGIFSGQDDGESGENRKTGKAGKSGENRKTGKAGESGESGKSGETGETRNNTEAGETGEAADRLFYLISGRVKLYVLAGQESAAPAFDSACGRMGDFYLPLYLCDRDRMASAWLLDRLPVFIPGLRQRPQAGSPMHIAVFGDHPGIVQLCKDLIASAQIEDPERFPFSLTVVGENAELLEERLLTDCPGLTSPPEGTAVTAPLFVPMRPETRAFQSLLAARPPKERTQEEEQLAERLQGVNYIVVCAREEKRNLTLAMYLREWYLRTDPTFARLPFIASRCENELLGDQFQTLAAGAETPGFAWHNNYQIEAFGTDAQLFSYDALVNSRLEQRALASHFSYYTFTAKEDRFRAEHDYYSRYYNRDSSLMNALSLPYRMFSAGVAFADWHDYAADISRRGLADRFEAWLDGEDLRDRRETRDGQDDRQVMREDRKEGKDPQEVRGPRGGHGEDETACAEIRARRGKERLEILSRYEHGRWNRSLISRGWMPASMGQMLAYIQRGTSRHQLYIGKLHPFLCSWEQLGQAGPAPTGVQKEYESIMRQIRPDLEPADIRGIDRENVRRTADILRAAP